MNIFDVQHGAVGDWESECAEESEEIVALDIFSPLATLIATYSQERQLYKVLFFL